MKIDVIIANPPYQYGNQSIYQKFIEASMLLCDNICMIVKNNWMYGTVLRESRRKMLGFGVKEIINFSKSYEIFKDVHTSVCIVDLKKAYKELTKYTEIVDGETVISSEIDTYGKDEIILNNIHLNIINKIKAANKFKEFDLAKGARVFSIASNGNYMLADRTVDIIKYSDIRTDDMNVELVCLDGGHNRYSKFTAYETLPKGKEHVKCYKVICGSKVGDNKKVLTNLHILNPWQIMTNSFSIVGIVKTEGEALALYKYSKTKFMRALIRMNVYGIRVTFGPGNTKNVPLQNFKSDSDIDWSKSISDIDKQLYKKYNLSDEEINYIEEYVDNLK